MAIPLTLRVYKGTQLVATKEFHRDIIKIGRLASAHLCIEDERVSRIHAVVEVAGDGNLSIIDMGSVEGTFVNGKRVSKAAIRSGDVITLGDSRLEVTVGVAEDGPGIEGLEAVAPVAAEAAPAEPAPVVEAPPAPEPVAAAPVEAAPVVEAPAAPAPVVAAPVENVAVVAPAVANVVAQAPAGAVATGIEVPASMVGRITAPGVQTPVVRLSQQRPRPLPLKSAGGKPVALDVRFYWGDQQLGVGNFDTETQVTVGGNVEADFRIEAELLPADPYPLLKQADGSWSICFTSAMDGELVHADGKVQRFAELVKSGKARQGDEGVYELPLPLDAAAWVDLGNIRADVCFRPKARQVLVPFAQRFDYQFLNLFLLAFFLVAGSIVAATNSAYDADIMADDLFSNEARFTKLLLEEKKRQHNPFLERLAGLKAPSGEAAAKAKGVEGQMGKRDAPKRNTRSAPRAIDINDKEVVKNQGILAMLGGKNAGLSTIFGKGGLGGDLKGAIGGITGASVGDAHGFGGLGLKGTAGMGGGGVGNTIGVGSIGTKGRGGGSSGYGTGVGGLGKKGSADVSISSSEAVVMGYDRELVRRVVHSHHSQLKYCYESEIVRNPNLNGKVTLKWVITGDGTTSQVGVAHSTLGNSKVESCIASRVRSWRFPKPQGGGIAVITYPFVFKPAG